MHMRTPAGANRRQTLLCVEDTWRLCALASGLAAGIGELWDGKEIEPGLKDLIRTVPTPTLLTLSKFQPYFRQQE